MPRKRALVLLLLCGQPVKGQAISADGAFVAASTYEDLLYFFNGSGKLIWKKEFLGTPVMLSKTKRILLVNDDDSDPETAFVTFDRAGRVVGAARVDRNAEPTDLSVSSDETFVAFALNPRKWQAWSPDGKLVIEGSRGRHGRPPRHGRGAVTTLIFKNLFKIV